MDTMNLRAALPSLLPKAIAWAEKQSAFILKSGVALSPTEIKIAKTLGVAHPESVRVFEVLDLPLPDDTELRKASLSVGLLGPTMVGLTLGYGIYIVRGHKTDRLVSHELRHVYQYESEGSINAFLPKYLEQLISFGYDNAPLEIDARDASFENNLL